MNNVKEIEQKIIELVNKLPLFPHDIDRLLSIAVKPTEDNTELLKLIEKEPHLWTELLNLAASYYGITEKIKTPRDAVHSLGIQPLVQLIGVSYARKAINEEFASLKYLNEYFDHSENISIGCFILAEICKLPREQRQIYAVAGLIHDIGRLAILVAGNSTSTHVLGTLWDKMASVVHNEKAALGTDHCAIGARICQRWNFAPLVQEAVSRHHTPLIDSDFSFPGAIIFIAHFLSASDPSGEIISTLSANKILENLDLTTRDFDSARKMYKLRTRMS